jgi:type IV secretion system protein VirD4
MTYKSRTILGELVIAALLAMVTHSDVLLDLGFGLAGLVLVLATLTLVPSRKLPGHRIRHHRMRLRLRLHPGRGQATVVELWLRWGRWASFRRSRSLHRSLRASTHSVKLGDAQYSHGVHVPLEEHVLLLAPPRTRKTGLLADIILRYPGPIVSTSTKHDVFELTSGIRSRGGPIAVFNPQNIGSVPSTFRWNPVLGCDDPAVAIRRADAFANAVSMSGTDDASFWASKASSHLRSIFHAAALVGGDARLVTRWALGSAEDAEEILGQAGAVHWAMELGELRGDAQKTAQTIRMVLSRALSFMADPALASSVIPGDGDYGLDLRQFIRDRGSLYMIASSQGEDSPLAPLFACLANEIHYTAALMGSQQPGGRLDPPLGMMLDEIVQVCPLPLPTMLADSGGKGIQVFTVAHGEAQLRTRWKQDGAQAVMDTSGVKVFLPGITDDSTLQMASRSCGQTAYRERGQDHQSRVDVLTPDMVRMLPPGYALVIRANLAPVVVRVPVAWKNRAYKKAKRAGTAVAHIVAAPLAAVAPLEEPVPLAEEVPAELAPVPVSNLADDFASQPERVPAHNPWG